MKTFQDFEINPLILKAIGEMGFQNPTPIQAEALPVLLGEPTDFLGLAATGTGKTVAFAIPLLERLKLTEKKRAVQGLILCPTRELAIQITGQINLLARYMGVRTVPIYGGAPYGDQIRGIKGGATIVVGTPGRVLDHVNQGTLDLSQLETVVLDEADEMISMGFKDDLEAILANSPRETSNTWFFCATLDKTVRKVAEDYLRDPAQVKVNQSEAVPEAIEQIYYRAHEGDKPEIVCKLIDAAPDFYGIIFCQTKALVVDLTGYLKARSYLADCLHGDMDQKARERTMQGFRERRTTLLVCTDVASRGIDVKDITHVINYSLPREIENYVHRIGRTARSGKTGFALNLVTPSHRGLIGRIEAATKSRMREGKLPTRKEIGSKKVSAVLEKFQAQSATFARAVELMDESWKQAIAGMSGEEIAGRFLSLNFPEVFADRPAKPAAGGVGLAPIVRSEKPDRPPRREREGRGFAAPRPRPSEDNSRGYYVPRPRGEAGPTQGFAAPRPREEAPKPFSSEKPRREQRGFAHKVGAAPRNPWRRDGEKPSWHRAKDGGN